MCDLSRSTYHIQHTDALLAHIRSELRFTDSTTCNIHKQTTGLQFYGELYFTVLSEDVQEPQHFEMCIHTGN
jgi:hypothetical protein